MSWYYHLILWYWHSLFRISAVSNERWGISNFTNTVRDLALTALTRARTLAWHFPPTRRASFKCSRCALNSRCKKLCPCIHPSDTTTTTTIIITAIMSTASAETTAQLPPAAGRVFFQPGVGCTGSGPMQRDDPVQKKQGKVTVKYDRKELRKRLILEEWIIEQLSELYDCEVRLDPNRNCIKSLLM